MKRIGILAACVAVSFLGVSCVTRPVTSFGPYSAAETYYKKGDYPKAIEKYQEYLSGNPQGNLAAIAEYYVGKSYAASGDMAKAGESYERVISRFPGTSWAEFSKEQLATLNGAPKA